MYSFLSFVDEEIVVQLVTEELYKRETNLEIRNFYK